MCLTDKCGVPKNSVLGPNLGPVLFAVLFQHIVSSLTNCRAHLYADDTVLHCVADSVHLAVEDLQRSFNILQGTLKDLRLVLNADEIKFMLFSRASATDLDYGLMIDKITEYKYLSIWIDEKLTLKFHTYNLVCWLK